MSSIKSDVNAIKRAVLRVEPPELYSARDIARSFFGALILASTFIFSSRLVEQTKLMTPDHVRAILLFTFVILSIEIYFIGYARVKNRSGRPFLQFWFKRIITFYLVAWIVAYGLSLLFAYDAVFPSIAELIKFTVVISFPASIGAALADLLRRY